MSDYKPVEYTDATPRMIQLAIQFGIVKLGYTLEDYLKEAVETGGYETVNVWGIQGAGKSSRMLQMGYWILEDWEAVLESVVFKPNEFVNRLKKIPRGERIPCLLWDDILVHYPSSTFRTDIAQYEAIDSAWAAIRTKVGVIVMSMPLIDRLAKNVKDNLTFEVFIGRNQLEMIERLFHLPSLKTVDSNFFKVAIEQPARFNLYDVPRDIWNRYWERRLDLTEEALERLGKTTDLEDTEGYTLVLDIAENLGLSPNTIQQMASRGVIKARKINELLYIDDEFIPRLKRIYDKGEATSMARRI